MRKPLVRLTEEQKSQIAKLYLAGVPSRELQTQFNVGRNAIQYTLRNKGVVPVGNKKITAGQERQVIELYGRGLSIAKTAQALGLGTSQVVDTLARHKVEARPKSSARKWNISESFFSVPTPELAYFAGFCFADGSIIKRGGSWILSIELKSSDACVLREFCKFIGIDSAALYRRVDSAGREYIRLAVMHKSLGEWMKPWGIIERKTYNFLAPSMPDHLIPHFMRGWIDGDGSILVNEKRWTYSISICGHPCALEWFSSHIHKMGYTGNAKAAPVRNKHASKISFGGRDKCIEVANLVKWRNPLRLERKWAKLEKAYPLIQGDIINCCRNGHLQTPENLYTPPNCRPRCWACIKDREVERQIRRSLG